MTDARDLVHPKTKKQMATLTSRAYRGIVSAEVRRAWFRLTTDLSYLGDARSPLDVLLDEATVRSGSVSGEQRRDVRDAIMPAQPQTGFSLVAAPSAPSEPAKEAESSGKKRGWW